MWSSVSKFRGEKKHFFSLKNINLTRQKDQAWLKQNVIRGLVHGAEWNIWRVKCKHIRMQTQELKALDKTMKNIVHTHTENCEHCATADTVKGK